MQTLICKRIQLSKPETPNVRALKLFKDLEPHLSFKEKFAIMDQRGWKEIPQLC